MKIRFEPTGILCEQKSGESLLQTALRAGIQIPSDCGGRGTCGKCKIKIKNGDTNPTTETERNILTPQELESNIRLACMVYPQRELEVLTDVYSEMESGGKKDMNFFPTDFLPEATVEKSFLSISAPSIADQRGDSERLLDEMKRVTGKELCLKPGCLSGLHQTMTKEAGQVTVVSEKTAVLAVEHGNTSARCFGIAFDIGTTTVVGLLWNLRTGSLVETEARTNPQTAFGADVISRICFAGLSAENLDAVRQKIAQCFEDIIGSVCVRSGISPDEIYRAAVVGNTAMTHLFLGVDASSLAKAPFTPVFCQAVELCARELGMGIHPEARVHILPNIAGHVGADISAVLLASRLAEKKGVNIAVDIGTNGEILLAKDGRIMACSTAAGPAFEGAEIHQGMRAAPGAIQGVKITSGRVKLSVIGGQKPVGLCGSGLIDAVAQLAEAGIINTGGRMLKREKALKTGISPELCNRLYEGEGGSGFLLYRDETAAAERTTPMGGDVVLTQLDIRQVQLAKGAILAGIHIMMQEMKVSEDQLEAIYLAGAFGNFVNKESVLRIGMLPPVDVDRVHAIGNAAGVGASMALLSNREYQLVKRLAADAVHVELAAHPDFQNIFVAAMAIGDAASGTAHLGKQ